MHALIFATISLFCRERLPKIMGGTISYDDQYYTDIREAQTAILQRHHSAAARILSRDGYRDGQTFSSYGLVNYLERGYVRAAVLSLYKTEFCASATSIDPDYRGKPVTQFRLGLEAWLRGDDRGSQKAFSEAIKPPEGAGFEEVNIARGVIALAQNPKRAYSYWKIALSTDESPPPISEANIAAAELLLHYRP